MTMEPCCALKYYPAIDVCQSEKASIKSCDEAPPSFLAIQDGDLEAKKRALEQAEEEDFGPSRIGKIRKYLWNLTEYPETSRAAQVKFSSVVIIVGFNLFV